MKKNGNRSTKTEKSGSRSINAKLGSEKRKWGWYHPAKRPHSMTAKRFSIEIRAKFMLTLSPLLTNQ
jgi:hypothetical protein